MFKPIQRKNTSELRGFLSCRAQQMKWDTVFVRNEPGS